MHSSSVAAGSTASASGGVGATLPSPLSAQGLLHSWTSPLAVVLFVVWSHAAAIALIFSPLVDLVADEVYGGNLQSAALFISLLEVLINCMQFFFDPLWGHLSDTPSLGRKPFLLLAIIQYATEMLVLFLYPTWWTLVLLGVARGAFGVGFTICSIIIMDISGAHVILAPRYLGYYGAASGFGFMFGALVGVGVGAVWGIRYPFFVAFLFEVVNIVWIAVLMPRERYEAEEITDELHAEAEAEEKERAEDQEEIQRLTPAHELHASDAPPVSMSSSSSSTSSSTAPSPFQSSTTSYNPFYSVRILGSTRTLLLISWAFFLAFLARAYSRIFFLYTKYQFGWSMTANGVFLAYIGLLAILSQGLGLTVTLKRLGESKALWSTLALNIVSAAVYAFIPGTPAGAVWLYVITAATAMGFIFIPILRAMMSREIAAHSQGLLGGAAAALVTGANLVGALVYGPLFAYFTTTKQTESEPEGAGLLMPNLGTPPFLFPGAPFFFSFLVTLCIIPFLYRALQARASASYARSLSAVQSKRAAAEQKHQQFASYQSSGVINSSSSDEEDGPDERMEDGKPAGGKQQKK